MDIEYLNNERKKQKLSIPELAKRANLPKSTVEKILFGVVKFPRIDTMQAIEHALGLDEKTPTVEATEGEKELLALIQQLTEEETQELSNFVDYILSKRNK